ncbi:MAG: hypothetical protein ACEPOV_13520 [Hyphomicrobiales bacterium]
MEKINTIIDLSGNWIFEEDFYFGKDFGFAEWKQNENVISGIVEFTECINERESFKVRLQIEGEVEGVHVFFSAKSYSIIESKEPVEYCLDSWEGIVNKHGQIVGSSYDEDGICGVFTMTRK